MVTEDGELWGYIASSGRWLIEPQFVDVTARGTRPFHDGLARATTRAGWSGFIDYAGRRAFALEPGREVGNFEDGFASFFEHKPGAKELRWGLVDKTGKVTLDRRQTLPEWME